MGVLILPSRFRQQPQQAGPFDNSDPLAQGLIYAWIPATNNLLKSGNPIMSANSAGSVVVVNGVNGYLYSNSSPQFNINEMSVSALLTPNDTSIAGAWAIGGGNNPDNGQLLLLGQSDNAQLGFATRGASNNFYSTAGTASTWANGVTSLVTGVRSSSLGTQKVYCRGIEVGSSAVGTDGTTTFNRFSIGGVLRDTFSAGWAGTVGAVYIHNRPLKASEVALLAENQWRVFAAPKKRIWVAAVGAVSPIARPAGVSATAQIGAPVASGAARASLSGVSASALVGAATASGASSVSAVGVAAFAAVGQPLGSGGASAVAPGVAASVQVGTASANGGALGVAAPAGVAAMASTGIALASGAARVNVAGVAVAALVGFVQGRAGGVANVLGAAATARVGQAAASAMNPGMGTVTMAHVAASRIVVFEGSKRVVTFKGSTRIVRF